LQLTALATCRVERLTLWKTASSCFDPNEKPPTAIAAVYDQWEW
jgi:hypothetical protein